MGGRKDGSKYKNGMGGTVTHSVESPSKFVPNVWVFATIHRKKLSYLRNLHHFSVGLVSNSSIKIARKSDTRVAS